MFYGIDVHAGKGLVDWGSVAASGKTFAFVKSSEGETFTDSRVAENVHGARNARLHVGCYHFARPDLGNSPELEASHFCDIIAGLPYDLVPVLDIEKGAGDLSSWALRFCNVVEARTGHVPMIYSYISFITAHLRDKRLSLFPLWVAEYQVNPPGAPSPWDRWTVWQQSSSGTVPGVSRRCDLNQSQSLPFIATMTDLTEEMVVVL